MPALARCAARLLRSGGTLLVADPAGERARGCRAALAAEAAQLGGVVSEAPLEGIAGGEELMLVSVEFPADL